MSLERKWFFVSQPFTANGGTNGLIKVADTTGFYVRQLVTLSSSTQSNLQLQIKRIDNSGIYVGQITTNFNVGDRSDVSAYLLADVAIITAYEQDRLKIKKEDQDFASYESEPLNARRVVPIDSHGNLYSASNPVPVALSGSVTIGTVKVEGNNGNIIEPNADGSLNNELTKSIGLFNLPYDAIQATYPSAVQENYQSYLGGLSGTPVQYVVVIYQDSTKNLIVSATRTPTG